MLLNKLKLISNNTLINKLKVNINIINLNIPKEIKKCHFLFILPKKFQYCYLISISKNCLNLFDINFKDLNLNEFVEIFSGNNLVEGLDKPYATVYGCHSYGTWFGQLGSLIYLLLIY